MNTTTDNGKQVAATILEQLGGRKFIAMTGSKNFAHGTRENGDAFLQMHLTKNLTSANRLEILLNADDTYTVKFYMVVISKKTFDCTVTTIKELKGVYCDMLQEIFTETTGLYTHL